MADRIPPTPKELRVGLLHLDHALSMVGALTRRLTADIEAEQDDGFTHAAWRESLLLNARLLIEFLTGPSKFPGDLWPTDYLPDWRVPECEAAVRLLQSKKVFDQHLAHFGLDRLRWVELPLPWPEPYDPAHLFPDIMELGELFAKDLRTLGSPFAHDFGISLVGARLHHEPAR